MPTVCALFMGVPIITTSETLSFYRYPKVKANPASDLKKPMDLQSNAWLKSLQRLDLLNKQFHHMRVCSVHFRNGTSYCIYLFS